MKLENPRTHFGKIEGITDLFEIILQSINRYSDYQKLSIQDHHKVVGQFMNCLMTYATWAKPNSWRMDHAYENGSFGIEFHGEYTFLIVLREDGTVGGHS